MTDTPVSTGLPRVLVSDDEEIIARTLVSILNQSGFSAKATFDGQSAVVAATDWLPHIFLCDVRMPEMDGIETAIRVCEILPQCRIVLISAQEREAARVAEQRALGYDFDFILKPIHPLELIQLLRFALHADGSSSS